MTIKIKRGGAYVDPTAILLKRNGVYENAQVLEKVAGNYVRVDMQPVVLTQAQLPYTLQASDSGKTFNVQPTAASNIIYPPSLGAGFACTIGQDAAFPAPLTIVEGSGVTGFNTNGLRILSSATQALGLGSPMIRGPGQTVTVTATAADTFTLGGAVGKWQVVANSHGWPDSTSTGIKQVMSRDIEPMRGAKAGTNIVAMRVVYTNAFGISETPIATDLTFASSLEWPVGGATTPQRIPFSAATYGTLTGGTGALIISDVTYPTTPIPAGDPIAIRSFQHGTGIVQGKGRGPGEYYNYSATDGTNLDLTMLPFSAFPTGQGNTTVGNSQLNSLSCFRPVAIIAVTDTGAVLFQGDSRSQPSNGDHASGANGYAGELEHTYGRSGCFLNISTFSDSLNNWNTAPAGTALRRSLFQFCGNYAGNLGTNDLNAGSTSALKTRHATFLGMAELKGRKIFWGTIPPSLVTSSDFLLTLTNQSYAAGSNTTANTTRIGFNDELRAGTVPGLQGYAEIADCLESSRNSGKLKINSAAPALPMVDISISVGSNVMNSASSAFTPGMDGCYVVIPMNTTGLNCVAVATYVSAAQMTLSTYQIGVPYNAVVAVAPGASVYVGALECMIDGITSGGAVNLANHESVRGGILIETLVIPPTIPAVGPIN